MVNLKIFTENIEQKALSQIYNLIKQPAFSECKVRIMAYKSINEIMENIKDTVEVVDIIKPIYNFKASE